MSYKKAGYIASGADALESLPNDPPIDIPIDR